ncbi:MAG: ATP-binding cassette domain-containing protein [Armatimonadetes bacterium]|nr:ATP-binding cassette domain-containing protein [Armatimonadota bacterium]
MVEVKDLTKYYGEYAAIEGVSFKVEEGEILGFLGPNAAGKTTTMRIVAGFKTPTSGTATVAGTDVVRDSVEARRKLGYLPEQVPLYDDMSVREYLAFCANVRGVPKGKIGERVDAVMDATRVTEYADALILKLSKGFRQRVGIAQALVHDPPLLILDEPTVGLDPRQIVEVRELIRGLRGSHTVILSTHILPEVQVVCDRVVIINGGRIAAIDTPEALTARLQRTHEIRVEVRGPRKEVADALRKIAGARSVADEEVGEGVHRFTVDADPDKDLREAAAALIVQRGWGLREMASVAMSLEDVYIQLTTAEPGASHGAGVADGVGAIHESPLRGREGEDV